MGQRQPAIRLQKTCAASPEVVYDLLASLRSHLDWGGARQSADFRLLSLEAPDGFATVGTAFSSTGAIPMSTRHWEDRSIVTVATRPTTFQFVTEGRVDKGRRAMLARYVHQYDMSAVSGGCRVTYTMTQKQISNPMLRLALPGVRQLTWIVAIPMFAGRGFGNLLSDAEDLAIMGRV
jgi:hypothetical protein